MTEKEFNKRFEEGRREYDRKERIKELKWKFQPLWLCLLVLVCVYAPMMLPSPFRGIIFFVSAVSFIYFAFKWSRNLLR